MTISLHTVGSKNKRGLTPQQQAAVAAVKQHGSQRKAAEALGISRGSLRDRLIASGVVVPKAAAATKPAPLDAASPAALQLRRCTDERNAARAAVKRLQAQVNDLQQGQDFYTSLRDLPNIAIPKSKSSKAKRDATPVLLASDWHFGETVTLEETCGRNQYNIAIAKARAAEFWRNALWLREDMRRSGNSCEDQVIELGGDFVSGEIHEELTQTNEVLPAEQVEECLAALVPGIEEFARDSRQLTIVALCGNHGRIYNGRTRIKTNWASNAEYFLYKRLQDRLHKHQNIRWVIPKAENVITEIYGYKFQWQHGTQIKSQGGIGGILVPLTRFAARAAAADYYVFSHFHQAHLFDPVIVNGSLIGDSAYSKAHGMSFRRPEQVSFLVDKRRGLRRFEPVSVEPEARDGKATAA